MVQFCKKHQINHADGELCYFCQTGTSLFHNRNSKRVYEVLTKNVDVSKKQKYLEVWQQ